MQFVLAFEAALHLDHKMLQALALCPSDTFVF
jgi:hypothetical protein